MNQASQTFSVADHITEQVARHVPASVLANGNVRILGTGTEPQGQPFYGLTLHLAADESCVFATGWLPEEGEHGLYWSATWINGVETDHRVFWDPVTGVDYGWLG